MIDIEPFNQTKLFGLENIINQLIMLDKKKNLPNKILLSGQKGLGKSTLAYHFINYVLSKDEEFIYDVDNFQISTENRSFKTILNKTNINFKLIDVNSDKKYIDINQIRNLILDLTKSSFNKKPNFVLIDNIEFLNINSINALLKILEEPSDNIHFILINNNKKILATLISRCINFKVHLSNNDSLNVANRLLEGRLHEKINQELINYYSTPGNLFNIVKFGNLNKYDLSNINLKEFLKILINNHHYKKDSIIKYLIFDFVEFYLRKINFSVNSDTYKKYSYFLQRISNTKKFNLDDESLFMEFNEIILNG